MRIINLLFDLVSGHADFVRVDDHHVVAGIEIRSKTRVIFTDQNARDSSCEAPQNHVSGIDYKPVDAYFEGFGFFALGYIGPH